tara:strand:+ start:60 stop:650 length:591 start_codon:yes stop_codon:yes gene_type:complete
MQDDDDFISFVMNEVENCVGGKEENEISDKLKLIKTDKLEDNNQLILKNNTSEDNLIDNILQELEFTTIPIFSKDKLWKILNQEFGYQTKWCKPFFIWCIENDYQYLPKDLLHSIPHHGRRHIRYFDPEEGWEIKKYRYGCVIKYLLNKEDSSKDKITILKSFSRYKIITLNVNRWEWFIKLKPDEILKREYLMND